jgi:hypothetical protein
MANNNILKRVFEGWRIDNGGSADNFLNQNLILINNRINRRIDLLNTRINERIDTINNNIFDSCFNNIDDNGNWSFKSKYIFSDENIIIDPSNTLIIEGSILTKNRIYQEINSDPSWNAVNGYYGLAKDAYPALSESTAEKATEEWMSYITETPEPIRRSRPHGLLWCAEKNIFISANFASTNQHKITTSPDGINWTGRDLLDPLGNIVTSCINRNVAYSKELDLFVMVGITQNSSFQNISTSNDGINWQQIPTTETIGKIYIDVVWAKELGLFVAVSSSPNTTEQIAISYNGINWSLHTIPSNLGGYQSVCWSAELGLLVVVRNGTNGVATSTDGINWIPRTTPNNRHFRVVWSAPLGLFVICSVGTGEALPTPQPPPNTKIISSPDGINWTYRNTPNDFSYRGLIWATGLNCFLASGTTDELLISFDGINWKSEILPNSFTNRCMCYSDELGIIVLGQDDALSNYLTSSLKGRPPTSYNVFDSSFNNIDNDGNWTLKVKEIYGDSNINVTCPNLFVDISSGTCAIGDINALNGGIGIVTDTSSKNVLIGDVGDNSNGIKIAVSDNSKLINIDTRDGTCSLGDINGIGNNTKIFLDDNSSVIEVRADKGYITHQCGKMARTEEIRQTIGDHLEPSANFFTTNNQNVQLYKVDAYFNPLTPKQDGWYCYLFNFDSEINLTSDDGKTIIGKITGPSVGTYPIQKWSTQRISLVWVDAISDYVWSVGE